MSQSHIHKAPPPPPPPVSGWKVALLVGLVIALILSIALVGNWFASFTPPYASTIGRILEIRPGVASITQSRIGARVFIRYEARVAFTQHGQPQERWIRITQSPYDFLFKRKLAEHPTTCRVYWTEDYPEGARCALP